MNIWEKLSEVGLQEGMRGTEKSMTRIANQSALVAAGISLIYLLFEVLFLPPRSTEQQQVWFYLLHTGIFSVTLLVLLFNHLGYTLVSRLLLISTLLIFIVGNSLALKQAFRTELYLFILAAYAFVVIRQMPLIIAIYIILAIAYWYVANEIILAHPDLHEAARGLPLRVALYFTMEFFVLYFLKLETLRNQALADSKNVQLSEEHELLQKQNFTKDKIFSIISHDLRSPINSLKNLLGMLHAQQIDIDEFKRFTPSIEKEVAQLSQSMDELLNWSKSQLSGITPVPGVCHIKRIADNIIQVVRPHARSKKITIHSTIAMGMEAWCDENMLTSVITNLLTNAVKFTPEGGTIALTSEIVGGNVMIRVQDTGVGIAEENLVKILRSSEHFTTRGTHDEKGTGLGLVMCREFLQKNNGSLMIMSTPGKGSIFSVELPKPPIVS
jgi:signal transduction histidine kinase